MQVDRVIKDRLDSFTFKRETEYRHPHLVFIADYHPHSFRQEQAESRAGTCKELHVQSLKI
jgi:hypothetical protein